MRVLLALLAASAAAAYHHNPHHDKFHHHGLKLRHRRSAPEGAVEVVTTADVEHDTARSTTAAAAPAAAGTDMPADTRSSGAADLRAQMAKMANRITELEKQLEVAKAPPMPPMPPPLARLLRHFGHRSPPHGPPPHGPPLHGPPPPGFARENEDSRVFMGWRGRHGGPHGHRRHHHPLLGIALIPIVIYGVLRCMKHCCCRGDRGVTEYPATLPAVRGGVVHNPYVGLGASSAAVVPTAEAQPMPSSVMPSAPAPLVEGFTVQPLQHGVVLGAPATGTPVGLVA